MPRVRSLTPPQRGLQFQKSEWSEKMQEGQPFSPFGLFTGIFIPEAICRSTEITPGAKLAFGRLVRYAGQDGRCFPFMKTLAAELGIKERQARYLVAELESAKLIRRKTRKAKPGDHTSNEIEFLWHPMLEASLSCPTSGNIVPHPVSDSAPPPLSESDLKLKESLDWIAVDFLKRVREENQLTDTHTPRVYAPSSIEEQLQLLERSWPTGKVPKPTVSDLNGQTSQRWEEFWGKYPRKQRKDFACSQFISLATVSNEAEIFACLDRYLRSAEVARGVVMNPDRWLYEQHCDNWQGDWPPAENRAEPLRVIW